MSEALTFNEGDIFFWKYTLERYEQISSRGWSPYHCKSQIAVVKGDLLKDTYWGMSGSEGRLDPSEVTLEFQGNPNTMTLIEPYERVFYRPEDVVDMSHPNNSGAPVYVKEGAARNAETMLEFYRYEMERERSAIEWAQHHIAEFAAAIAKIERGETDGSFPLYVRSRT